MGRAPSERTASMSAPRASSSSMISTCRVMTAQWIGWLDRRHRRAAGRVVGLSEAGGRLGLGKSHVAYLVKQGKLKAVRTRVGSPVLANRHALCSRGGWTGSGEWIPLPYVDERAAETLFGYKVLALLRRRGLLSQERIDLLNSWRRSGFFVHNRVFVRPRDGREFEA